MGRIAQPEHGAYSLNVCPAFESRGFAPVLLAFVLGNVFFSSFFLQLFLAHGSSTLANLLSVQKPKHIRDRLRKWWKQGDVVWSASTLRFKTLLACCSTVVLAFACASYQTQVDALGSRLRFRSASRTLVNAVKECVFMVAIAAHMQKVHSVPYLTAKRGLVERTVCCCKRSVRRLLSCLETSFKSDETTSCVSFGFKSFQARTYFSNYSDFLLRCSRFW